MHLAWMTDIHLNFLGTQQIEQWLQTVATYQPDALLITGDIGEASSWADYLERMSDTLQVPIYFILGNHDYYHGRIASVRKQAQHITHTNPHLHWLPASNIVSLTNEVSLVGHSGWGDAGYGNFLGSPIRLNDYLLIRDFATLNKQRLQKRLQELGQEAADYLRQALLDALKTHDHVLVGTHVPPFMQAAWHAGQTPDATSPYVPHFTCRAVGDMLLEIANTHPTQQITVLCGHTHGEGTADIRDNLQVITGGATYGRPAIQKIFKL